MQQLLRADIAAAAVAEVANAAVAAEGRKESAANKQAREQAREQGSKQGRKEAVVVVITEANGRWQRMLCHGGGQTATVRRALH